MFFLKNIVCLIQPLKQPKTIEFEDMVTNISCHPTRDMIASGDINGVVRLYVTIFVVIFHVLGEEVLVVSEPIILSCIVITSECVSFISYHI